MKKLVSLVSVIASLVIMTMSFSAAGTDAYSIYNQSQKAMEKVKSVEIRGTSKASMELNGQKVEVTKQNITIKTIMSSGNKLQMEAHTKDANTGDTEDMFYKDGFLYLKTADQKTKQKMDMNEVLATANALKFDAGKETFKTATVEKVDGGNKIKFKIKTIELKDEAGNSIVDMLKKESPDAKIEIGDINYSMTIGSDNMVKSYSTIMNISMEVEKIPVKVIVSGTNNVYSINTVKNINFPTDLASYKTAK